MAETPVQPSIQNQVLALAATNPEQFKNVFRLYRASCPEEMTLACLLHLAQHGLDQSGKHMILWLSASPDYLLLLLDRQHFTLDAAKQVSAILFQHDRWCISKLMSLADQPSTLPVRKLISRALELIDVLTNKDTLIPWLRKLADNPDVRIRTKAIKTLCGLRPNPQLLERQLNSADERVRASVIEASWHQHSPETIRILRQALTDDNHRVVINALVGLHLLGDAAAFDQLSKFMEDSSPMVRRGVIWAFGHIGDQRAIPLLERLRNIDEVPAVRSKAAQTLALFTSPHLEAVNQPVAEVKEKVTMASAAPRQSLERANLSSYEE